MDTSVRLSANCESFEYLPASLETGLLILCDHASNELPQEYGRLGLAACDMERHIAFDIGAAGVTRRLVSLLGAPAVLTRFSRLLIDPNRALDDPTLIMQLSDGTVVPGNRRLTDTEVARRIRHYYEPYHSAIKQTIDAAIDLGAPPVLFSVHSFTERWRGRDRPWDITVLWDNDPRLPVPLLDGLASEPGLVVGENEPYSGELEGDCLNRHGTRRGIAHALVEIRQDLIRLEEGQIAWAERLAGVLAPLMQSRELLRELHQIKHYGSRSD